MNILLELINRKSENTASGTKKSTDATAREKKNKTKQNKQRKRKQNKKVLEPDCLSDQFFLTERVVARSFKIIAFSSLFQEITFSNSAI